MVLWLSVLLYLAGILVLVRVLRGLRSRNEMVDRMYESVMSLGPRQTMSEERREEHQMAPLR